MKRIMIAAALLITSGMVNAQISFLTSSTATRTEAFNIAGFPTLGTGTTLSLGALLVDEAATLTFTYLGQDSTYINSLKLLPSGPSLFESNAVGTSISTAVAGAGAAPFSFVEIVSPAHASAINGGHWDPRTSIGLIGTNMSILGGTYAYVLGYNDSAGTATLGDWDDFVIGVNAVVTLTPEPEVYGMLAAGLGFLGWVGLRRKQSASA